MHTHGFVSSFCTVSKVVGDWCVGAQVSLFNIKKNGKHDYLSVGEDMLPTVYMVNASASCCRTVLPPPTAGLHDDHCLTCTAHLCVHLRWNP